MQPLSFTDPSQNYIAALAHPLDALFLPKTVALIGAKDDVGSVGRTLFTNLLSSKVELYPVNPKRSEVLGKTCYKSVSEIPAAIDLAIIVTPAKTVPQLIKECKEAGVKGVIIISAGFKELGKAGELLEEKILQEKGSLRIIGPNCLGLMNPSIGLNASFAKEGLAHKGNIAFLSQSGAMCTAVLDWSAKEHLGFSAFVSVGSMIDVGWGDLIRYFGNDPNTDSILIYMETVGNAKSFLSAAKEIALDKPIIVIKPGRSVEAATAAASHTGSLTGSDEVFDAALDRVGVLRVSSIAELFHMAQTLGKQPLPNGPNLHIITNAGGPAVLATDAAVLHGAKVLPPQQKTIEALNQFLPAAWSHSNPIDILGDASAALYEKAIEQSLQDSSSDGVLVILSPQDMTDPVGTAAALQAYANQKEKPLLASWMGGAFVEAGVQLLNQAQIPTFSYPDDAAWSFATMWRYKQALQSLYETPSSRSLAPLQDRKIVKEIIEKAQSEKRTLLSEFESKTIIASYGIPTVKTILAHSKEQAVRESTGMGFPVVLKLYSDTITHKSDVGGVKLNLNTVEAVEKAYDEICKAAKEHFQGVTVQQMIKMSGIELILGSMCDPQFGPVLLFGAGGIMVEVFRDRALGLPPLNETLARQMMAKTKIYHALQGFRGRAAVSQEALTAILVGFSTMIASEPWIKECDINPLLASSDGIVALDARIVLHDNKAAQASLAIRPYPVEYETKKTLKNGQEVLLRPIRPEDEHGLIAFHKELSENSIRQRYFEFKSYAERVSHNRLIRICSNDFDEHLALVAQSEFLPHEILGVARLIRLPEKNVADLKMILRDDYQGVGLGTLFMQELLSIAKNEGITKILAHVLMENSGMLHLLQKQGFVIKQDGPYAFAEWVGSL
jgi:acetyltransferase